jgi:hypothetical protein
MKMIKNLSFVATLALFCAACMSEEEAAKVASDEAQQGEDDAVQSTTEALTTTGTTFTWKQGNPSTPMGSSTDRFCFLTEIGGHFQGSGESVHAYVNTTTNTWYLGGTSGQTDVHASARCVPLSANGKTYSYTTEYTAKQDTGLIRMGGTPADRVCFLEYVSGHFEGYGENVYAFLVNGEWWLGAESGQTGVSVKSRCLVGTTATSPFYYWAQDNDATPMKTTSGWVCGLTRMQGKFKGFGEYIRVTTSAGTSYLGGGSGQTDVSASAMCAN